MALVGGAIFHEWMGHLTFLSPYLIFAMLLITYCRLELKDLRFSRFHFALLGFQTILSAITYFGLLPLGHTVAEGVFICVFIPTATAAPVITAMLGGSISRVAGYSLLCNVFVSLTGPVVLAAVGDHSEYTFIHSVGLIMSKVFPLLIAPIFGALLLKRFCPAFHKTLKNNQSLSFYLWAVALIIVVGGCVSFVINHWVANDFGKMILMTVGALAVCLIQFKVGRKIGGIYGDTVSGGQSLGQKNTVLAVWLAMVYMTPIASIAPAAYIAWQNIINSWQIFRKNQKEKHNSHQE